MGFLRKQDKGKPKWFRRAVLSKPAADDYLLRCTMTRAQPLQTLIERRLAELDLRLSDLAERCGYDAKAGVRAIASLCHGDLDVPPPRRSSSPCPTRWKLTRR